MRRASCLEQLARFHTAKNGIATRYRFSLWTGPFRGCFQFLWKFDTLWEHPLGKGEATCHSSWLYSFMYRRYVEGYYKSSSRHGMAENTLLVAEGIFAL